MTDARDPAEAGADRRDRRDRRDDEPTTEDDRERDAATSGDDPNDLDADNAVEADSIETLDPENPPA
ncbi:hypothetical protein JOE59_002274 [Agromyces cerinus]|uniref:hypothetical protein n=1 Tax=Agromyces cerinus TaxID=33878 RepID=UPI001956F37A|nr:hypothetical protein [Agromyces cerinus]MBM7831569.1 hypothetical protein [Agromyces cerinus]